MQKKCLAISVLLLNTLIVFSQGYKSYVYKNIDSISLSLVVKEPDNGQVKNTVIIFFHGGSYVEGDPLQFMDFYDYFTKKGFVTVGPRYRFLNKKAQYIDDIFEDAVDAINWVVDNSISLKINSDNIYLCGYSAGAHLSLSTVMNNSITKLKKVPKGLIVIAPPVRTLFSPRNMHIGKVITQGLYFSPYNNIKPNLPPMFIFQGTADKEVSCNDVVKFVQKMKEKKNNCQIKLYEKRGHYLFNSSNDLNDIFETMNDFIKGI